MRRKSFLASLGGASGNLPPVVSGITVTETGGVLTHTSTYFDPDGDLEDDQVPLAIGVGCTGINLPGFLNQGEILAGSYTYEHINQKAEGTTTFKFYAADDAVGTNETVIATTQNFTLTSAQLGKHIDFGVRPVTSEGTLGAEVRIGYSTEAVGVTLTTITALIKFCRATFTAITGDTRAWNIASSDTPNESFELNHLIAANDSTTSTSSNPIPTTHPTTVTFTVGAGLPYVAGKKMTCRAGVAAYFWGTVVSYTGTTLVISSEGNVGTGTFTSWLIGYDSEVNLDVDLAMSSQAGLGVTVAGTGAASDFPAGSGRDWWYTPAGAPQTRGFQLEIPSHLRGRTWTITTLHNRSSTAPNAIDLTVGGVNQTIADVTGAALDDVLVFNIYVDTETTSITFRFLDGSGICMINAMKISTKVLPS
ncbi:hypothetical protein ACFQ21_00075 [Ohtaekwangia kribbensis]|uniref:Uncharacterized protein n=1 Tax=Ohtaekwangia kribbensis TaxID=688913 RepID=A0ABW3JVX6_9BACT